MPPYETLEDCHKITKNAKIKWILTNYVVPSKQQCGIPNCHIKSYLKNAAERKKIYGGDFLKAFVNIYITKNIAEIMMNKCIAISKRYAKHFIAGAQSTTLYFLLIGKYSPKSLTKLSDKKKHEWGYHIPKEVILIIAKMIWESRYQNEIWGKVENTCEIKVDQNTEDTVKYDEDHYNECDYSGPHGWTPWYEKYLSVNN